VAVSKKKDIQDKRQVSLIPVIEREEEQLRTELEQVRREAENQIRQAEKQAEQHIQESRQSVSELVEQKRKEGFLELQQRAEQLSRSSEQHSVHLRQQVKRNMAGAVQRVVEAVTAMGDET
jgi:F0F1-type ATP synthase membrane subunit b/b'